MAQEYTDTFGVPHQGENVVGVTLQCRPNTSSDVHLNVLLNDRPPKAGFSKPWGHGRPTWRTQTSLWPVSSLARFV